MTSAETAADVRSRKAAVRADHSWSQLIRPRHGRQRLPQSNCCSSKLNADGLAKTVGSIKWETSVNVAGKYRLTLPRETVWSALNDPDVLRSCIPGCEELAVQEAGHYQARIKISVGPLKATFDSEVKISDSRPPEGYRLEGSGKSPIGFGSGYADVSLVEEESGTLLSYSAKITVGGRLAQIGSRLVVAATRKIADEFFDKLISELDDTAKKLEQAPPTRKIKRWPILVILALLLCAIVFVLAS